MTVVTNCLSTTTDGRFNSIHSADAIGRSAITSKRFLLNGKLVVVRDLFASHDSSLGKDEDLLLIIFHNDTSGERFGIA